jgi:hypothetical protein
MKRIIAILALVLTAVCSFGQTTYYGKFYNSDGTIFSNKVLLQAFPPNNSISTYGTNIVWGGLIQTNQPTVSSGLFTNQLFPNTYSVTLVGLNFQAIVNIPDSNTNVPLAFCFTNVPVFNPNGSTFGLVTNWLGYWPATNTTAGISAALGYTPLTNTLSGIVWALGYTPLTNTFSGVTWALGYTPMTNTLSGLTNSIGYWPATNTLAGISGALGYTPCTNNFGGVSNSLGYWPCTNTPTGIAAGLGFTPAAATTAGITTALGYTPPTNTLAGIVSAIGYTPGTNITWFSTPSNNTNSYKVNTVYTNSTGKNGWLFGYAQGTILDYTNQNVYYFIPVTNNFTVPLSTNATFFFQNNGFITNVVLWY